MTGTRSTVVAPIGLRRVRYALRTATGLITNPEDKGNHVFAGYPIQGSLSLNVAMAGANLQPVRGDDVVFHTFALPPTDKPSGDLRVSKMSLVDLARITGTTLTGSDTKRKIALATNKQGAEPNLILWGSCQAVDAEDGSDYEGSQLWLTYFLPNALAIPQTGGMEDSTLLETTYNIICNNSNKDPLGTTLTDSVWNCTSSAMFAIVTAGMYQLDTFTGDGTTTAFTLSQTPSTSGVLTVSVNGSVQTLTTDYTVSEGTVTFESGSVPADDAVINVEYEYDYA